MILNFLFLIKFLKSVLKIIKRILYVMVIYISKIITRVLFPGDARRLAALLTSIFITYTTLRLPRGLSSTQHPRFSSHVVRRYCVLGSLSIYRILGQRIEVPTHGLFTSVDLLNVAQFVVYVGDCLTVDSTEKASRE